MIIVGIVLLAGAVASVVVAVTGQRRFLALLGATPSTCGELLVYQDTARSLGGEGGFARACEVVGAAIPGPDGALTAELSGTPCVWYRYEVHRRYWEIKRDAMGNEHRQKHTERVARFTSSRVFAIRDASGEVTVRPERVSVDGPEQVLDRFVPADAPGLAGQPQVPGAPGAPGSPAAPGIAGMSDDSVESGGPGVPKAPGGPGGSGVPGGPGALPYGALPYGALAPGAPGGRVARSSHHGEETIGYQQREWVLRPGAQLYVLGEASDRSGELEIGKPASGPYIVSTRTKQELTRRARLTQRIGAAAGAVLAVAGVVTLVLGLVT